MSSLRGDRGAAVVEFALVLPILLLLVVGIMEFGRAYYLQTTISGAAREGARVMAVENNTSSATTATISAAQPLTVAAGQIQITPASCASTATATATATVTVRYPMTFLTGLFGSSLTLTGKGVMRCNG